MSSKITFKWTNMPATIAEPFCNLIRKSVYTLKESYVVCGISGLIRGSENEGFKPLECSPYEVLPNTTSSLVDFSILFASKKYSIKDNIIEDFKREGFYAKAGHTKINNCYKLVKEFNGGVTSLTMQDFSEFFDSEDNSVLISFNQKVSLSLTFYILKIESDLSTSQVEQILSMLNDNKDSVTVVALPAQLNKDIVSINYDEKNNNIVSITVDINENNSDKIENIVCNKLPQILENVEIIK